jgi:hypothetical protein
MNALIISCLAPMEVKRCRVQIRIILNRKGEIPREPGPEQAVHRCKLRTSGLLPPQNRLLMGRPCEDHGAEGEPYCHL